jgi:hypothetical protein
VPDDSSTDSQGPRHRDSPEERDTHSNDPKESANAHERVTSPEDRQQAKNAPARTPEAAKDSRGAPLESAFILSRKWQTDAQQFQRDIDSVKSIDAGDWVVGARGKANRLENRLRDLPPNEEQGICEGLMYSIKIELETAESSLEPHAGPSDYAGQSGPPGKSNAFRGDRADVGGSAGPNFSHHPRPQEAIRHLSPEQSKSSSWRNANVENPWLVMQQ